MLQFLTFWSPNSRQCEVFEYVSYSFVSLAFTAVCCLVFLGNVAEFRHLSCEDAFAALQSFLYYEARSDYFKRAINRQFDYRPEHS